MAEAQPTAANQLPGGDGVDPTPPEPEDIPYTHLVELLPVEGMGVEHEPLGPGEEAPWPMPGDDVHEQQLAGGGGDQHFAAFDEQQFVGGGGDQYFMVFDDEQLLGVGGDQQFAAFDEQQLMGGDNHLMGGDNDLAPGQQVAAADQPVQEPPQPERQERPRLRPGQTTLIIHNFPPPFNPAHVLQVWPPDATFDYLEIPYHAVEMRFKGYILLNFPTPDLAQEFGRTWHGRVLNDIQRLPLNIGPANVQGIPALVERFRGKDIWRLHRHGHLPLFYDGLNRLNSQVVMREMLGR